MAHDLIVIITRIQTLKGATNTEESELHTLRVNAETADQWLIDNPNASPAKREGVHEYLEAMQTMLGEHVTAVCDCNANYPL